MAAWDVKCSLSLPIGDRRKWDYITNEIKSNDPFVELELEHTLYPVVHWRKKKYTREMKVYIGYPKQNCKAFKGHLQIISTI